MRRPSAIRPFRALFDPRPVIQSTLLDVLNAALYWLVHLAFFARAILRPHRDSQSRIAWVVVMAALPVLGIVAYLLLGETNVGRRRVERMREVLQRLPPPERISALTLPGPALEIDRLFRAGASVNGFAPVPGNRAQLLADSPAAIASMVADIDAACEHVHVLFYIWLADASGLAVAQALMRAAARGVVCRVMADALGSRALIASPHWRAMREAGVRVAAAMPIGNPLLRVLGGRIDLRNHRKIVVIDDRITYCGSQNCADAAFLPKARFAPWVDVMLRFEGPVARQNQTLFAGDWMADTDEDLSDLLQRPQWAPGPGFPAQVIGTGPTVRHSAMPEVFQTLMYEAHRELFVTSPYYVPDEALQAALCACARRGVATTIIFPQRNDSWIVGAASRSFYAELLAAGVRIFEFRPGLLHAKTLTIDGECALIGSANMDRRSFDLNYENNILLRDVELTAALRRRQQVFLEQSAEVDAETVRRWSLRRRLWINAVAMLSPVL
ncbi:MAG: cardiolipin synthase [Burkholderiales bacterium]|nr:cardiolipin synthase [Burkholderiales bacterium]